MAPTTQQQRKKRPAPSQSGPKTKKPHLEAAAVEPAAKKRSRPVTAAVKESDSESSDDGSEAELDGEGVEEEEQGDEMEVEETKVKDPNGMCTSRFSCYD